MFHEEQCRSRDKKTAAYAAYTIEINEDEDREKKTHPAARNAVNLMPVFPRSDSVILAVSSVMQNNC